MNCFRRLTGAIAVLLMGVLVFSQAGYSATQNIEFSLSGSGSLLNSPPGFEGTIDSGVFANGFFTIYIDDTGWPVDNPGTPQNERWNYIISTFFTYTAEPNNEHWTGYFPLQGTIAPPVVWRFYNNGDKLGGIIRYLNITITDNDKDGVIDQDELMIQAVAANLQAHIEQSKGVYESWCGFGSMNGTIEDFDPTPMDMFTIPYGLLRMRDYSCAVPTEHMTWGAVKSLYAE